MQVDIHISVVICIYNGGRTLKDAIDSLLEQDYPKDRYEIILVNDGSTDNSELICHGVIEANKDKEPKLTYAFQENAGLGSARNTGVFLSRGDLVAFMDQDAIAQKTWLTEIKKAFNDDKTIGAVGGKIELLNSKSWFATFVHWIQYYREDEFGKEIIPLVGTNMAFRKETFQGRGGFFENFRSCGDDTSFTQIKVLPYFKQNAAVDAVIYHERPWTFRQWLKERFSNGCEHALRRHITQKYIKSFINPYVYFLYRVNSTLLLALIITMLFYKSLLILTSTIVVAGLFFYRCFIRNNLFQRIKILNRKYGYCMSIWLIPLYLGVVIIGKFNEDIGFIRGFFKYRNIHIKDTISGDKVKYIHRTETI